MAMKVDRERENDLSMPGAKPPREKVLQQKVTMTEYLNVENHF